MKRRIITLGMSLLMGFSIIAFTSSCKKEGCTSETATNYDPDAEEDDGSCEEPEAAQAAEPSNPQPTPTDADAVFIALSTVSYVEAPIIGVTETTIGLPVALFIDGTSFKDVGAVSCEGENLSKQSNNSYVYQLSTSNPSGVSYGNPISWDVAGGSGFPAYSGTSDDDFPSNLELTTSSNDKINTAEAFTLETTRSISMADSVYFSVVGPDGSLLVTKGGNSSSHTFTAAEMATVGKGFGFVQLAAYRIAKTDSLGSGEKLYFINQKVNTTAVEFE